MYNIIQKNPEAFIGYFDTGSTHTSTSEAIKSLYNSCLATVQEEDRETAKKLLLRLFPKFQSVWRNNTIFTVVKSESLWRKRLRICSPEIFPRYFQLAIPGGDFSNFELKEILALVDDVKKFKEKLVELSKQKHPDGITRARLFLERLEDYTTEEIPLERIPLIVQALFNIGDQLLLPEDDKCRMFDFGNETRIGRVIYQMLRRLDEQERFSILKKAIENGNALSIIEYEVITYGQAHGKYGVDKPYPEDKWIVSEQHLQELEKITLEKVSFAAQHDLLLQTPKLASILYRWQDWAGEKEVKQWVEKVVSKDESLIVFLEKFLQITFSIASSDVVSRKSYRLNLKQLEHFLDLSKIIERVRKLSKDNWLTANQKNCNQRV